MKPNLLAGATSGATLRSLSAAECVGPCAWVPLVGPSIAILGNNETACRTKDARLIDAKLVAKYGINVSRASRSRRKLAGSANLHYIRHERLFVLLATHGKHSFFDEEKACIRDIREIPIQYGGYSISYRRGGRTRDGKPDPKWHSHVEIARGPYKDLKAYYLDMARHRIGDWMAREFYQFPFEPYAPIRRQLLKLLRKVNRVRKKAGYTLLPPEILPMRRRVVKPFRIAPASGHGCSESGEYRSPRLAARQRA